MKTKTRTRPKSKARFKIVAVLDRYDSVKLSRAGIARYYPRGGVFNAHVDSFWRLTATQCRQLEKIIKTAKPRAWKEQAVVGGRDTPSGQFFVSLRGGAVCIGCWQIPRAVALSLLSQQKRFK